MPEISTKPYLLRAIYEWCTDNGYTPYLAAIVDAKTRVPREYVKNGEIVLNISFTATSGLKMGNEWIEFNARFGGISREISIPIDNVVAIYARENGQGMAFEVSPLTVRNEESASTEEKDGAPSLSPVPVSTEGTNSASAPQGDDEPPKKGGRPTLTRIK